MVYVHVDWMHMFIVYKAMQQSPEIELTGCTGGNAAVVSIQKNDALLICTFMALNFQVKPAT